MHTKDYLSATFDSQEEMEDLRLVAVALTRIQSFKLEEAHSHKKMMDKYAK